jgi:hypothetical protein
MGPGFFGVASIGLVFRAPKLGARVRSRSNRRDLVIGGPPRRRTGIHPEPTPGAGSKRQILSTSDIRAKAAFQHGLLDF